MSEMILTDEMKKVLDIVDNTEENIFVTGKAGAGKNSSGTAGNASRPDNKEDNGGNLVNINTADVQALTKIKGIGPAMAQKIIDYRESNGSFQSVEELQKVKGIGPGKYAKIQGQVTI